MSSINWYVLDPAVRRLPTMCPLHSYRPGLVHSNNKGFIIVSFRQISASFYAAGNFENKIMQKLSRSSYSIWLPPSNKKVVLILTIESKFLKLLVLQLQCCLLHMEHLSRFITLLHGAGKSDTNTSILLLLLPAMLGLIGF